MHLREHLVTLIDRICFGYCSLVTGYNISIPPRCQATAGPYRELESDPPLRLADAHIAFEPYRDDTPRSHGTWADRIDFAGTVSMYLLIKDAFEREGLPYRASYRRIGGDSLGRDGNAPR